MEQIEVIEEQLKTTFASDKTMWIATYKLIDRVETSKLWRPQYQSFTQWINHLADLCGVHVSVIWKRLNAGRTYASYSDRAAQQGRNVPTIDDATVSPDNLELINKIAQSDSSVADQLIDRTLRGELSRDDLRNAWGAVKSHKEERGQKAIRVNAHDSINGNCDAGGMTAGDIILALSRNTSWLETIESEEGEEDKEEQKDRQSSIYHKDVYHIFPEFPVRTGTTRHARRIDALVVESYTSKASDSITLHGIEIKVNKNDLIRDHKMLEYKPFVDMLYFAIPAELYDACLSIVDDGVGIIIIDKDGSGNNTPRIIRQAALNKQAFGKLESLSTALVKALLL